MNLALSLLVLAQAFATTSTGTTRRDLGGFAIPRVDPFCKQECRIEYQECLSNGVKKISCQALRGLCEHKCKFPL